MCFELLHRYKPNLEFLEPFGSPCTFIDADGKFGAKANEGFFVGYASPLKRVFVPVTTRNSEPILCNVYEHVMTI